MIRRIKPITRAAMAGALVFTVAFFGLVALAESEPADQSGRIQQINAQMDEADAAMERAAAALCRAEMGPGAQVLWTHQGDLVCRPAVITAGGAQ